MAVYTEVSFDEAQAFLQSLGLGTLQSLAGCAGGIENTNYFVNTDQGEYVLTLFERLTAAQLPFYLRLMKHLAQCGIPVPEPQAVPLSTWPASPSPPSKKRSATNAPVKTVRSEDTFGQILHSLKGKPAAVVNKLAGSSESNPTPAHCAAVGDMLARMHLAGQDFEERQPNLRGLAWLNETVPEVLAHLTEAQRTLILGELAFQNHVAASSAYRTLPRGPVHADLFRDNVMFESDSQGGHSTRLTGFFDFYFAGHDTFLLDISVCLNDWCVDLTSGANDPARGDALVYAYQAVRRLTPQERHLLPAVQRAGALRFWTSRLRDFYLPRTASVLKAHDPGHFERVLRQRLVQPYSLYCDAFECAFAKFATQPCQK